MNTEATVSYKSNPTQFQSHLQSCVKLPEMQVELQLQPKWWKQARQNQIFISLHYKIAQTVQLLLPRLLNTKLRCSSDSQRTVLIKWLPWGPKMCIEVSKRPRRHFLPGCCLLSLRSVPVPVFLFLGAVQAPWCWRPLWVLWWWWWWWW